MKKLIVMACFSKKLASLLLWGSVLSAVLSGCDRVRVESPLGESQVLTLNASIGSAVGSKAPIDNGGFAYDAVHSFGIMQTNTDGITPYADGSGHIQSEAAIDLYGQQTWAHTWGGKSSIVLPPLMPSTPMLLAAYCPYDAAATLLSSRDGGWLNVPFDLTTAAQQTDQTDLLYSSGQRITYKKGAGAVPVALNFQHFYALLEFQVKLKTAGAAAKITKVEVCNKKDKSFLSNKGWYSPYSGAITSPTAGNVSFTTATDLSAFGYATIRVMVPPTLLANYADGDIYVQMYDNNVADPKQFPILKSYLTKSGTYGFAGGGRYTYRLVYDNLVYGSLTVVGWAASDALDDIGEGDISGLLPITGWGSPFTANSTLGSRPINPPTSSQYVTLGSLYWATGNLVATGKNSCKVGEWDDYGVYFQFGSLVGWTGGATGNGVGTGVPALDKAVWPVAMGTTKPTYTWRNASGLRINTLEYSYFNYSIAPWDAWGTASADIGTFAATVTGEGATTGTLRGGRYANLGVGDPCTYYLGEPWRTPTSAEYLRDLGTEGSKTNKGVPLWVNNTELYFRVAGYRSEADGSFLNVTTDGMYWNSSVSDHTLGSALNFVRNWCNPAHNHARSRGFPVRCVATI